MLILRRAALAVLFTFVPAWALASPAPVPTASFDAGSVHVDQYGNGQPALVLIPGLTDSALIWNSTIAHFAPAHRVYALTLPGFGGRAPIATPMLDRVDADIAAFLPQAGRPVLIGHSMGGHLALRLAAEHSDLIAGAIAVDGTPILPGMETMSVAERAAADQQSIDRMRGATPEQFQNFEKMYLLPYMTQRQNVDAALAASAGADPAASAQYMQELIESDLRPQLAHITVPTLEIVPFDRTLDPKNPQSPFATANAKRAAYAKLLAEDKTAKIVVIKNSRHFVMLDQPKALFAAIERFLKALPKPRV